MKALRIAVALWLCCVTAWPAEATVAVTRAWPGTSPEPDCAADEATLVSLLQTFGATFRVLKNRSLTTEWARTGTFVWNFNELKDRSTSYDVVVHVGFKPAAYVGFRLDSLTLTAKLPTVPTVFILSSGANNVVQSSTDTTAVSVGTFNSAWGDAGFSKHLPGSGASWAGGGEEAAVVGSIRGGMRVLISGNSNARDKYQYTRFSDPISCVDCDSTTNTNDTALVWVALNQHKAGAAYNIFACPSHQGSINSDPGLVLAALAFADSVSGHKVFEDATKLPVKIGFQIRGGWRRGDRSTAGGISPNDSTAFKASIDSLNALGIPFAVGVNLDSLESYTDDRNWWGRATRAHYAPENWGGVVDTSTSRNSTRAAWQTPTDVLGRWRTRIAWGGGTCVGKDTSLWCLMRASYYKTDSAFGASRTDHALIAPAFDWTPKNLPSGGTSEDSLFAYLRYAGVKSIVTSSTFGGGINVNKTNPTSLYSDARNMALRYGPYAGQTMPIVATPGYQDSGSARFESGALLDGYYPLSMFFRLQRFWDGLSNRGLSLVEGQSAANLVEVPDSIRTTTRIYTIHASDLGSGTQATASTRPTRPGWWQIKYIVNEVRAINALAGRTLISIEYPENVPSGAP